MSERREFKLHPLKWTAWLNVEAVRVGKSQLLIAFCKYLLSFVGALAL